MKSLAPNDRAMVMACGSSDWMPVTTLIRIAIRAPSSTTAILRSMPIPTQMMNSGSSATRGTAFMKVMNGLKIAPIGLYQPIRKPSGMPTAIAMPKPQRNSSPLIQTLGQSCRRRSACPVRAR